METPHKHNKDRHNNIFKMESQPFNMVQLVLMKPDSLL